MCGHFEGTLMLHISCIRRSRRKACLVSEKQPQREAPGLSDPPGCCRGRLEWASLLALGPRQWCLQKVQI